MVTSESQWVLSSGQVIFKTMSRQDAIDTYDTQHIMAMASNSCKDQDADPCTDIP